MKKATIIFCLAASSLFAQPSSFIQFPHQPENSSIDVSQIIALDDGSLLLFYADSNKVMLSKSPDKGVNWATPTILYDSLDSDNQTLAAIKLKSGRILLSFNQNPTYLIYSDDNADNWSDFINLNLNYTVAKYKSPKFAEVFNNVWYYFLLNGRTYYSSSTDGTTWNSNITNLPALSGNGTSILQIENKIMAANVLTDQNAQYIDIKESLDSGKTWINPKVVIHSEIQTSNPNLYLTPDSLIHLFYQEKYFVNNIVSSDVKYVSKPVDSSLWSEPSKVTNYVGNDFLQSVSSNIANELFLSFGSFRNNLLFDKNVYREIGKNIYQFDHNEYKTNLFLGMLEYSTDSETPPFILDLTINYRIPYPLYSAVLTSKIIDDNNITDVAVEININSNHKNTLSMYDDGIDGDEIANDNIYTVKIDSLYITDTISVIISAKDEFNNFVSTVPLNISPQYHNPQKEILIDINNIKIPINNRGTIGDVDVFDSLGNGFSNGHYEESTFLFSGGFMLSGYSNGNLWSNAMATSSRIEDFVAGKVDSDPDDIANVLYVVKSTDLPFSKSWLDWITAVEQGAKFYDGDGDGIYNPVDLNNNGQWDSNEDRPDLIGDVTAWCVYNDGVPAQIRRFNNVNPQDIEIKQTVFAYSPDTYPELSNVIFIRYNIENKGTAADLLDSVYFSMWSDPDVGDYNNDYVGSDTILSSGYCYDEAIDQEYGNSPAFFMTQLQGPAVYIPGITFNDVNNNFIYDEGIDIPLDTANYFYGSNIPSKQLAGATNKNTSSIQHYIQSDPAHGDPSNEFEQRCYALGKTKTCAQIDPCNWAYGKVLSEDCSLINPVFMYSGDPVSQNGWLCNTRSDHKLMVNSGPFKLEKETPQEIIVAYIVGRGTTSLESVSVAKGITKDVIGFYESNFTEIPVGVKEVETNTVPTNFILEQNYPNPFNPTTAIKYSIPQVSVGTENLPSVQVKIFDVLGREVVTLVNQKQKPGSYEINFDASKYASGVYYYQLKVGKFINTKKMILLK